MVAHVRVLLLVCSTVQSHLLRLHGHGGEQLTLRGYSLGNRLWVSELVLVVGVSGLLKHLRLITKSIAGIFVARGLEKGRFRRGDDTLVARVREF